jgi:hypothetical protein
VDVRIPRSNLRHPYLIRRGTSFIVLGAKLKNPPAIPPSVRKPAAEDSRSGRIAELRYDRQSFWRRSQHSDHLIALARFVKCSSRSKTWYFVKSLVHCNHFLSRMHSIISMRNQRSIAATEGSRDGPYQLMHLCEQSNESFPSADSDEISKARKYSVFVPRPHNNKCNHHQAYK